jgi:hypothetical protein
VIFIEMIQRKDRKSSRTGGLNVWLAENISNPAKSDL